MIPSSLQQPAALPAVGRFRLREHLGGGALGEVYRATDERRRQDVALKMLTRAHPDAVYRFKQEFRALCGLIHPNLVTLYSLEQIDGTWTVAMALVQGAQPFLDFVRPYSNPRATALPSSLPSAGPQTAVLAVGSDTATCSLGDNGGTSATLATFTDGLPRSGAQKARDARRRAIEAAELRVDRLRAGMSQLVEGVSALHRAGLLHRDLKPSNVLVDASGRVVVCDFGLVSRGERERHIVGTPAYASPEQLGCEPLGPASDWYSVGAMLYEALTGRLPTSAPSLESLVEAKRAGVVTPPLEIDKRIDPELATLAMELLSPDPAARPDAVAILERLQMRAPSVRTSELHARAQAPQFVGREPERARLLAAFEAARAGRTVAVIVEGPSGVGKSALVAQVMEEARRLRGALVLAGRCYEAESVPFKAIDSVIDALADHLLSLSDADVDALVDVPVRGLVEQFPVLLRVHVLAARAQAEAPSDAGGLHGGAATALAGLLASLARVRPTVVVIDDLHWGDLDSAPFLRELVGSAREPGILLVATQRHVSEDGERNLATLLRQGDGIPGMLPEVIELAPLDDAAAATIVAAIIGADATGGDVQDILRDAGGSPMFIAELAYARAAGEEHRGIRGLDELIARRVATLADEPRALLEAVAIAGRPQPLGILADAAKVTERTAAVAHLQAGRFVRVDPARDDTALAPYHDRIREAVVARLDAERRRTLHRRLARALESMPERDLDALVEHWRQADEPLRAAEYALAAAQRAIRARAFRRAAQHFATVLALSSPAPAERARLLEARADALAQAGNTDDAVEAYAVAAEAAEPDQAAELACRSLVCLLRATRASEATAMSRRALAAIDVPPPPRLFGALAIIAWHRMRFAIRRPDIREVRQAHDLPPSTLRKLDVSYAVATALGFHTDTIPGFAVHTRFYRDALAAGEPRRAVKALGAEAIFNAAASGARKKELCDRLFERALQLATEHATPELVAYVQGGRAFAQQLRYEDVGALRHQLFDAADVIQRDPDFGWEADISRLYACNAAALSGDLELLRERLPAIQRYVRDTGNEYAAANLRRSPLVHACLANDVPDEALHHLALAAKAVSAPLSVDGWNQTIFEVEARTYAGDTRRAVTDGLAFLRAMRWTSLASLPITTAYLGGTTARALVADALRDKTRRSESLAKALRLAKAVRRQRAAVPDMAGGFASLVEGLVAWVRDDLDGARASLRAAIEHLDRAGMIIFSHPTRLILADLSSGDEAAALREPATRWAREQRVANLDRYTAWICPSPVAH